MNGLKFIRTRCNISLSELANVLGVSRQHISAWENGVKSISQPRLSQLSEYFGIDEKYFGKITEDDKKFIINKSLYRRQDNDKEVYCFIKQGEIEDDVKYREYCYPAWDESLDEKMNNAKKMKKETIDGIERAIGYFGIPNKLIDEICSINRGCEIYGSVTKYLEQMPNEEIVMRMVYYNMLKNILMSLLFSHDLISREEVEKEFEYYKGNSLYYDIDWVLEQTDIFKRKYAEKRKLIEEETKRFKRESLNSNGN